MTQPPGSPGPAGPYGPYGTPGPNGPHAPQGAPPPYPQAPSAYPPAPTPYASNRYPSAPGPMPQTPIPPTRRSPILLALAIVLGLALVLTAAYVIGRVTAPMVPQPTPTAQTATSLTPTPTPSKVRVGFTLEGSVLSGPTFTATNPSGWVLAQGNGGDNDGAIVKGRASITYSAPQTGTAQGRCTEVIDAFQKQYGGNVFDITGNWGRRATVTKHLVAQTKDGREVSMVVTCVDRPGDTAAMMVSATDTDHTQVATDLVSLLNSWAWL